MPLPGPNAGASASWPRPTAAEHPHLPPEQATNKQGVRPMKPFPLTLLALALAASFPAQAQSNAEILKELQDLKAKVQQLETKLKAQEAKTPATPQWGMTPEQARELNRVAVKTEALEDAVE